MSTSYTEAMAASLNLRRQITMGVDATLVLLNHAASGGLGYDDLATPTTGWTFRGPENRGEPWLLEICESTDITEDILLSAAAFRINGRVWVPIDNQFTSPSPVENNRKVWRFELKLTSDPSA